MKIGVSYWMFDGGLEGRLPVVEALRQAKSLGFEAIELCIATDGELTERTTELECRAIVAEASRLGIAISSVASGQSWFTSPTANDAGVRAGVLDFTRKALRITQLLGADAYLFVPGAVDVFFNPESEIIPYDVCYERAQAAVASLRATAEATGVCLCIENVWNKFLLSPLEMRDFIDSFQSSGVGAYFDIGNVVLTGYPDQWIRILNRRIKRVHVKDFKKSVGTVAGFVDLGEGDVDFELVKQALNAVGYDGYVTAELLPYSPGRLEKSVEFMRKQFK